MKPEPAYMYNADSLQLLEGWEAVRKRPGMYVGNTGISGLTVLAQEIIRGSLDEFQAGYCQKASITIHYDGSLSVIEEGRPPDLSEIRTVINELHKTRRAFTINTLSGVGVSVVAALSSWLICEVQDGTKRWQTQCEAPQGIKANIWADIGVCLSGETGISFHFLPDPTVFMDTTWDSSILLGWLWEQVHLHPGLTITFTDERQGCEPQVLFAPDGLREFLPWGLVDKTPIHDTIIIGAGTYEGMHAELALSFIEEEPTWRMYGCGIPLREGGTPLTGLRTGLARTLGKLAGRTGVSFQPEKARLGVAAIVSVWTDRPVFGAPTKNRMQNPEAEVAVARVVRDALIAHAREYPDEMQAILNAL